MYNNLKQMPSGGLASFLESNMDEIGDNVLAFGSPNGINSMTDIGNRMAGMGRNGDSELVHMKTGEIAVSPELLEENPRLANELTQAFDRSNVDMDRYTAGSEANSINPLTGQREFFLKKLIGGIKKLFKAVAPVIIPLALNFFAPGLGSVASGALGAGIGTLAQGGSLKDAFKSAALGGFVGGVTSYASAPTNEAFQQKAFGRLGGYKGDFFNNPFSAATEAVPAVNKTLDPTIETAAQPKGAVDTMKGFYDRNLAPSRNISSPIQQAQAAQKLVTDTPYLSKLAIENPGEAFKMAQKMVANAQPNIITQYAPTAALALAGTAALGGLDTPENKVINPYGRTSREEFESNPNKYSIFSGINFRRPITGRSPDINNNPFVFQDYLNPTSSVQTAATGGEMEFPRRNGYIGGPGTETSDDIPAMLSDGEFVMTSRAVRGLGNGSRKQGVRKMYDMMRAFEGGVVA